MGGAMAAAAMTLAAEESVAGGAMEFAATKATAERSDAGGEQGVAAMKAAAEGSSTALAYKRNVMTKTRMQAQCDDEHWHASAM